MKKSITILLFLLLLISCSKDEEIIKQEEKLKAENKVLVLKVDFATNTFEGGKELLFDNQTATFTTNVIVQSNDACGGNIKVFYQELNQKLFEVSEGLFASQIAFPTDFLPTAEFESALTADYFLQPNFQNIYNPNNEIFNFESAWIAIQSRIKVRSYMTSNPNQIAKIFLFTEYGISFADGLRKKWIIILKK